MNRQKTALYWSRYYLIIHDSFIINKQKNRTSVICFKTKNRKMFLVSEWKNQKPIKIGPFFIYDNSFYCYSFLDWRTNRSVYSQPIVFFVWNQKWTAKSHGLFLHNSKNCPVLVFANSFFCFTSGTDSNVVDRQKAEVKCKNIKIKAKRIEWPSY